MFEKMRIMVYNNRYNFTIIGQGQIINETYQKASIAFFLYADYCYACQGRCGKKYI